MVTNDLSPNTTTVAMACSGVMVKAGMGIPIMANRVAKNYAANDSLALIPLDHVLSSRSWYACFHKDADDAVKGMAEEIAFSF